MARINADGGRAKIIPAYGGNGADTRKNCNSEALAVNQVSSKRAARPAGRFMARPGESLHKTDVLVRPCRPGALTGRCERARASLGHRQIPVHSDVVGGFQAGGNLGVRRHVAAFERGGTTPRCKTRSWVEGRGEAAWYPSISAFKKHLMQVVVSQRFGQPGGLPDSSRGG
jgi:hypothetical protein